MDAPRIRRGDASSNIITRIIFFKMRLCNWYHHHQMEGALSLPFPSLVSVGERLDEDEEDRQAYQGDGAHESTLLLRAHGRRQQLHADRNEDPLQDVDHERKEVEPGALARQLVDGGVLGGVHEALGEKPTQRLAVQFLELGLQKCAGLQSGRLFEVF